jgi:glycosyltransferase involved in cell wall biosynthesis
MLEAAPPDREGIDVLCLIPVRNGSRDLRLCLDSLQPLGALVIALDDGSTDVTRAILDGHKLVMRVLENPRRETYEGWDDGANRARLLEAAAELSPKWIFWLDADEVLPRSDALCLKAFLRDEAIRGVAYGVYVHRMIDGMTHSDKRMQVFRIFAFNPEDRLPTSRLHFRPVPTSIDPTRWIRTRFRLKHRANLTEVDRERRFQKYREADPGCEFQASYENLRSAPGKLKKMKVFDGSRDVILDRERFDQLRAGDRE